MSSARKVFEVMIAQGCVPTAISYTILIQGYRLLDKVDNARKIFEVMIRKGFAPCVVSYSILIEGYCKSKRIDKALDLIREMYGKRIVPNIVTYTTLVNGLCHVGRLKDAFMLVNEIKSCGIFPNIKTYSSLIDILLKNEKLDEAQELLENMEGIGLVPDIVLGTSLISVTVLVYLERMLDADFSAKKSTSRKLKKLLEKKLDDASREVLKKFFWAKKQRKVLLKEKKFDDQKEEHEKDKEGEHGESPMKEKEKENLDQLKKDSDRGRNFSVTGEEPAEDADEGEERSQGLGDTIMASSSNSQNGDSKELIEGETVYKKKIGRDLVFDSRDGVEVGLEDGPGNKLKYGSKKEKEKENYMEACNKRPNKENKEAHYAVNVKENQRRESAYEHSVIPETGCVRKNSSIRASSQSLGGEKSIKMRGRDCIFGRLRSWKRLLKGLFRPGRCWRKFGKLSSRLIGVSLGLLLEAESDIFG
ncbi:hypothetical protein L6452_21016 [Arctium lappa]|uniref:Uncharacterized protein n=1 Tax=Arctium lappa TaxID=4217 RepID=A0ACB9BEA0_ARCLA|nr:hypothetical protein L6452_21016 [Arctium lappa]